LFFNPLLSRLFWEVLLGRKWQELYRRICRLVAGKQTATHASSVPSVQVREPQDGLIILSSVLSIARCDKAALSISEQDTKG
jgi:hypothetical protein